MISQTAEYALRAMVYLGGQPLPCTNTVIAANTNVPNGYLAKVMHSLGKANLVQSRRGQNGGFTLLGDPETLTVWDVVQAVDPLQRITKCPLSLEWHGQRPFPLHEELDVALALAARALRETTIQDVLDERRLSQNPCRFSSGRPPEKEVVPTASWMPQRQKIASSEKRWRFIALLVRNLHLLGL